MAGFFCYYCYVYGFDSWNFVGTILCSKHSVLWRDWLGLFTSRLWEWTWSESTC